MAGVVRLTPHRKHPGGNQGSKDTNLNSRLDAGERRNLYAKISVPDAYVGHPDNGDGFLPSLTPHQVYTVRITPESIHDPNMIPTTGHVFAFVAEPGHGRAIEYALHPLPVIQGQVNNWPGANEVLEVVMTIAYETCRFPVFQDGGLIGQVRQGAALDPPADSDR